MRASEHNTDLSNQCGLHKNPNKTLKKCKWFIRWSVKINTQNPTLTGFMQLLLCMFYRFMTILELFLFFSSSIFACFAAEQNRAIEKVVGQIFKLIMLLQTWRNVLWCPNKFLLFFFQIKTVLHRFIIIIAMLLLLLLVCVFFVMCEALKHDSMREKPSKFDVFLCA